MISGWMGLGWKSLYALILRAPLCGANNCEEKWAWASEKGKLFIYWIFIGTLSQLFNTLPPNFLVEASNLRFETKKPFFLLWEHSTTQLFSLHTLRGRRECLGKITIQQTTELSSPTVQSFCVPLY